ncbi:Yos1-like family protein [Theileria parva strain Muguga]|uniref:Yos1-like family protein n=1 Tax=Theileria parva strain Muguga TaxID=333668 RepID=UPI001C62068E|nr:Yos1-like family protein [Theileria parva strain Muguga]KAF5153488.1 Yos1-like family protein [Theileria parva strain Muguga]
MVLSFIHLVEASVLLLNAMGILNEKRVLRPLGLDKPNYSNTFKSKLSLLFHSVRTYLRVLLILLNIIIITLELLVG